MNERPVLIVGSLGQVGRELTAACGRYADAAHLHRHRARLQRDIGFEPSKPLQEGIPRWVPWHKYHMGIR